MKKPFRLLPLRYPISTVVRNQILDETPPRLLLRRDGISLLDLM